MHARDRQDMHGPAYRIVMQELPVDLIDVTQQQRGSHGKLLPGDVVPAEDVKQPVPG